jgi:hypothetical protein
LHSTSHRNVFQINGHGTRRRVNPVCTVFYSFACFIDTSNHKYYRYESIQTVTKPHSGQDQGTFLLPPGNNWCTNTQLTQNNARRTPRPRTHRRIKKAGRELPRTRDTARRFLRVGLEGRLQKPTGKRIKVGARLVKPGGIERS